jgi:ankyrin repeat protein
LKGVGYVGGSPDPPVTPPLTLYTGRVFDPPQGDVGSVASRLAKGDDVEHSDYGGRTALSLAAGKGHAAVVELLLGRGKANPNTQDFYVHTPLYRAAKNGHASAVRVLLEHNQTNVNLADHSGYTPLMIAVDNGCTEVARLLVKLGHANPDLQNSRGATALGCAARGGNIDLITIFLEQANANIHLTNTAGDTALTNALAFNHLSAAILLVIHGAQPNLAQHPPTSPKHAALQRGLALRDQVTQHRQHRRTTVLGWLQEQGVPADVGQVVVAGAGEVVVSEVLQELGISL